MDDLELCLYDLESFQTIWKVSGRSKKCPDHPENVAGLSKILQNHLLCAFVANLKIGAIYALYLESFCDKNLAIRKVFAFCDSASWGQGHGREREQLHQLANTKCLPMPFPFKSLRPSSLNGQRRGILTPHTSMPCGGQ